LPLPVKRPNLASADTSFHCLINPLKDNTSPPIALLESVKSALGERTGDRINACYHSDGVTGAQVEWNFSQHWQDDQLQ